MKKPININRCILHFDFKNQITDCYYTIHRPIRKLIIKNFVSQKSLVTTFLIENSYFFLYQKLIVDDFYTQASSLRTFLYEKELFIRKK